MSYEVFEPAELLRLFRQEKTPATFFRDMFFKGPAHYSAGKEIVIDKVNEGLPIMAPFVSPMVGAKAQKRSGYKSESFAPAYLKPMHRVDPSEVLKRMAGEPLLGMYTPTQRYELAVADCLRTQKRQIEARLEHMAAQAIVNGKVIVEGEDYPRVEMDFKRDKNLFKTLTVAGSKWSNTASKIKNNLEEWSQEILELSGYAGKTVIYGRRVGEAIFENNQMQREFDLRRGITSSVTASPRAAVENATFQGMYGDFEMWMYTGKFRDQKDQLASIIGDDEVLIVAPTDETGLGGVEGIQCYGAIEDIEYLGAEPVQTSVFSKMKYNWDPSGMFILSQCAPLPILGRQNAVMKVKVL